MSDEILAEPDAVAGARHPRHTPVLYGQEQAESALLQAFNGGRLHNGWLIVGPRGVGKATLAWRIARFLLSQPGAGSSGMFEDTRPPAPSLDISPDTPLAHRIAALSEPRLFLCRRPWDAKTGRLKSAITVDEVRKLKNFFNLSAADGGRRVVIIDAADEMNNAAANALLKILEEPPDGATLLLVSHAPMRLLPTIRSRCRTLKCASLSAGNLARALDAAGFEAGENTAHLGVLASGSVGEAIRILSGGGLGIYADLLGLLTSAPRMARPAMIALAESCTGKLNEARYDLVLRLLGILLQRLAITGTQGPASTEAAPDEGKTLARLSPSQNSARAWAELSQTLAARSAHARAVNLDPASVILDMLLKIDQMAGSFKAA